MEIKDKTQRHSNKGALLHERKSWAFDFEKKCESPQRKENTDFSFFEHFAKLFSKKHEMSEIFKEKLDLQTDKRWNILRAFSLPRGSNDLRRRRNRKFNNENGFWGL